MNEAHGASGHLMRLMKPRCLSIEAFYRTHFTLRPASGSFKLTKKSSATVSARAKPRHARRAV